MKKRIVATHQSNISKHQADVVIIGGGVVGASIAYHLTAEGCRDVLIVEREEEQGLGSTGKATGGARVQFATPINVRMSRYSIDFFAHAEDKLGCDVGYRPNGYLFIATSDEHLRQLRAAHEVQFAAGVRNVQLLEVKDIKRIAPEVRCDDATGGSFCPTDGFIEPLKIMQGFTRRACERGARVLLGAKVTSVEMDSRGVTAVVTTRGRIATRQIVNAAGAWAAQIARMLRVNLPVVPLRRQIVSVEVPQMSVEHLPMVIDMANGFHFRPEFGFPSSLLIAAPDVSETTGFKTNFDETFINKALTSAWQRAPFFARARVEPSRCRAGLYEMTPDHHAIIGEAREAPGFFLANGFSGHGVMHSPATGLIIAELILTGESRSFDLAPLALNRFNENRLHEETTFL